VIESKEQIVVPSPSEKRSRESPEQELEVEPKRTKQASPPREKDRKGKEKRPAPPPPSVNVTPATSANKIVSKDTSNTPTLVTESLKEERIPMDNSSHPDSKSNAKLDEVALPTQVSSPPLKSKTPREKESKKKESKKHSSKTNGVDEADKNMIVQEEEHSSPPEMDGKPYLVNSCDSDPDRRALITTTTVLGGTIDTDSSSKESRRRKKAAKKSPERGMRVMHTEDDRDEFSPSPLPPPPSSFSDDLDNNLGQHNESSGVTVVPVSTPEPVSVVSVNSDDVTVSNNSQGDSKLIAPILVTVSSSSSSSNGSNRSSTSSPHPSSLTYSERELNASSIVTQNSSDQVFTPSCLIS